MVIALTVLNSSGVCMHMALAAIGPLDCLEVSNQANISR